MTLLESKAIIRNKKSIRKLLLKLTKDKALTICFFLKLNYYVPLAGNVYISAPGEPTFPEPHRNNNYYFSALGKPLKALKVAARRSVAPCKWKNGILLKSRL